MTTTNGSNGVAQGKIRFRDIPDSIEVPVAGDFDEAVEIDLLDLSDDPTELCTLFENEHAAKTYWMTVALAYTKQNKINHAIEMVQRGASAMQTHNPREKVGLVALLCWLYIRKCREAPRVSPDASSHYRDDNNSNSDAAVATESKEYFLGLATQSCNDATRLNPTFPPLYLAKGVLFLIKASLAGTRPATISERLDLLKQAIGAFESALKPSGGNNVLAIMGKAKANFSLGKYPEALSGYQDVLRRKPSMTDPDPRIGIGCCFWQLGFKEDASTAWKRSLELNQTSKIANILLGLFYLDSSGRVPINSPDFVRLYRTAMTEYTQRAFKLDKDLPITCATFAGYFVSKRNWAHVESLSHKAIQYTDVNAIASDGWYLLARREHMDGDMEKANMFYRRSDDARGGTDSGHLPAKFGVAQLSVMRNDLGEAKLRLEKMMQSQVSTKSYEAMVLLGTLYAEEVFANQLSAVKEDKSEEAKKATNLLENAKLTWKDPKKNLTPDANVLLNLARLYEAEHADKALQCLLQAEQVEIDRIPLSQHPERLEGDAKRTALRKFLPPQLLNNIGCFYSLSDKHELASDMFEAALGACLYISRAKETSDTDTLVTTISFNLGRSYESRDSADKAVEVYEGLLARHDDYIDARTRLAYIKLRKNPAGEGPEKVVDLYKSTRDDLEVRALYGWFLGKQSRKRPADIQQDQELRHYKHTLQQFDKHDRYALVGMGNIYLMTAREMRRDTDQDRQKRSVMYSRAVEFFDKALQLDPCNAYAAEGVAIALIEDKKDYKNGLAVLLKVRETIKDAHVYVNLGHIYTELRQFSKAIESYEIALSRDGRFNDVSILSCLGRAWLARGRVEKDLEAYERSLEYAQQALAVDPKSAYSNFNVAFVQIQLASLIHGLPETQRTLLQLEDVAKGLESAIEALDEIAKGPQHVYRKEDIEQRVNMARNTQRKQLEKAIESQREYEDRNKEKLAAAVEKRHAELRKREEERQKAVQVEKERQERLRKDREEIAAQDRIIIHRRQEEDSARVAAEYETDSETGEKIKKKKRKAPPRASGEPRAGKTRRKKNRDDGESEGDAQPKKRRKLATKKDNAKYKSAEIIVDSDEEDEEEDEEDDHDRAERALQSRGSADSDERSSVGGRRIRRRRRRRNEGDRMDVDDEEEEEEEEGETGGAPRTGGGDAGEEGEDNDESMTRRQNRGRGRIVDESDEDQDEWGGDGAVAGDTSMVEAVSEHEE
ncbi:Tetratricopeptide repeat protein 1 [Zalerion maritima]|uniref:Tetratricopeptide repeat protein 1 n=1 Tax=Zalerion maritima TaxID=339359 RepID=A0AAD5RUN7_9PEZI|nr:Tetratricopeptide repeat protein 1 [Zalerion maritima]